MDTENSDVVLKCQGEEIPAHTLLLGARSPVFKAMFQSEMSESINKEVKIDDVEADVLKEMLRFMYSAKVDESFIKFQELLIVADKYQIVSFVAPRLRSLSTRIMFLISELLPNFTMQTI